MPKQPPKARISGGNAALTHNALKTTRSTIEGASTFHFRGDLVPTVIKLSTELGCC